MSPPVAVLGILALVGLLAAAAASALWLGARRQAGRQAEELDALRRRLERAEDARETFFDLVTHELRSPLASILGYQELLADGAYGSMEDRADEPVQRIGRSARHLLHLIDGVVELSRIRSGQIRPSLDDINLGILLGAVVDAFRSSAHDRNVEVTVAVDDGLPTIRSDRDRLVRALDLLVTSGLKHPGEDGVGLTIARLDHGATVRLTGTAIETRTGHDDPALRLGIRLAVAQGVAHALGGRLDLDADDQGVIRTVAFHIQDYPREPAGR